jgi:hypothetical protein
MLQRNFRRLSLAVVCATLGSSAGLALGDPLPGEVLKFYQAPLNNAVPIYPPGSVPTPLDIPASPKFPGHDELSTASLSTAGQGVYTGTMMADDFGDTFTTPIVHVMFWGSYMNGYNPLNTANGGFVQRFLINFYTENPGSAANGLPSSPRTLYSSQIVTATNVLTPGDGKFTETPVAGTTGAPGTGDSSLYQYNAELRVPAPEPVQDILTGGSGQVAPGPVGTVDWISIVALTGGSADGNPAIHWGWHDRDYGIFDPLAIGANPTGPGENNLNPGLANPPGQPVWHFQDDAVSNNTFSFNPTTTVSSVTGAYVPQLYIPGVDIAATQPYSKDLAFALYTTSVPEPASLGLMAIGALTVMRRRRR